MNKTLAEATTYVDALVEGLGSAPGSATDSAAEPVVFIVPPLTALATVAARLPTGSPVLVGAQNAHWETSGAWTGEVSMTMIKDAGASVVEIGHSERREWFGETDATVAAKVRAALAADLVPVVCVGEPAEVRAAGRPEEFVAAQVRAALAEIVEVDEVIIAYEPIWAIGEHGRPATPPEIAPVLSTIRTTVVELSDGAEPRAVLYGGSVDQDNAGAFLADPNADGLFVGRAAWQPAGLLALVAQAREQPLPLHPHPSSA